MLKSGDRAPGFGLPESDGERVHLSEFRDEKNVVLYFYPKDDTPGCTVEAQDFTRLLPEFEALHTVVLGVSRDDTASHCAFRDKFGLRVPLLADVDGQVCEQYGVWQEKARNGEKRMGIVRSTFLIDRDGIIREALYGVSAEGHAADMLERVRRLEEDG